jgi:hypothetical protein
VDDATRKDQVRAILQGVSNVRDPDSKEGNLPLNAATVVSPLALGTNPNDDATFLRYRKNDPLAQVGLGKTPVGVPPAE